MKEKITIIGAGLAGCEAALYLAEKGFEIDLYEMRPAKMTAAHTSGNPAELVCSNSLKSTRRDTASGLLKAELKLLGCKLLPLAEACRVPAGHALAVDREAFGKLVQTELDNHPHIRLIREEATSIPSGKCIIAGGPLSSDALMHELQKRLGDQHLYFFDAIAPIIDSESIDRSNIYQKDRYDKGDADYLNCAFDKEEYYRFVDALICGEKRQAHEFEDDFFRSVKFHYYENCIPIEELARRGVDTLRHGVMRPMGLEDPKTGKKPFAVLQLRAENRDLTAYNLVGCQTMLRYPEQKRIFRLIPGLENVEFLRYGSIHRNSYLCSPQVLSSDLSLKIDKDIFIAGQLSGVEGYVESIGSGLLIAKIISEALEILPQETILGQLWRRLIDSGSKNFQPVNANFGLLPALESPIRDKKLKKDLLAQRSLNSLQQFIK
ncbi:MAG: methylenetetrahydrofolate--tRNA-(uracil(54)-C(5))-methyltransferase (FADH(2)-oxidizing) TrmFO [Candidatus Cloacimonadaceae bacterium]|nr:methylenetetrahydrofolate--tRNA-(uracil(54)-C(5))-methyltransferase (FADH(2)-oxidizing) TrmFO [Candidatus Cloacimonadaceae bacterium]MDP3113857.1 methylenetetrahydrofolate--tRNA-(uracil(54)-C(5))-methyltransferase (FADH(2)-oxidizing) TrmFO [Candidatus Cloacimonadaceae bacterium]